MVLRAFLRMGHFLHLWVFATFSRARAHGEEEFFFSRYCGTVFVAMEPWIPWWLWVVLGLGMMGLEVIAPTGFFIFFFGIGALVTGLLAALGLVSSLVVQAIVLIAVAIGSLVLFRKPLLATFHVGGGPGPAVDSMVGQTAVAIEAIAPGGFGKVELRGSTWSATNTGTEPIEASHRCRVEKVDGLTLHVRA
jgi:membrane protein implicated in regulation of membrane protease activity